jgi:hypothetical protein
MTYKDYNKIIFVHIPRTGGNSIRESLKPFFNKGLNWKNGHRHYEFHNPTEESFSFSFVRNPYDIAISFWNYCKNTLNIGEMRGLSFKEWVHKDFPSNWLKKKVFPDNPIDQYAYFVRDGEIKVNFLGRHENLENDWKKLLEELELPKDTPLKKWSGNSIGLTKKYDQFKKKNKKKRKDYFDPETLKYFNNKMSRDFEFFGYKKM